MSQGTLYIVATPIGCLEDLTFRALRVLQECDYIIAEDTRHTRKLCTHYNIKTPLKSFHQHSSDSKQNRIVADLREGKQIAMVTDAGTPVVSDPGSTLIAEAAEAGVRIDPIPGASALTAALSVAGTSAVPSRFEGFLPKGRGKREKIIAKAVSDEVTTVFFESPHRAERTLDELAEWLPAGMRITWCRELTKTYQEILYGTPAEIRQRIGSPVRGELTIVIHGGQKLG